MLNFSKEVISKAADVLSADDDFKALVGVLRGFANDDECSSVALINRNHYFATVLWQEQDIVDLLRENGIEASQKNISAVLNNLSVSDMEDCSKGWELLQAAVDSICN